jgi:hypothetical protein
MKPGPTFSSSAKGISNVRSEILEMEVKRPVDRLYKGDISRKRPPQGCLSAPKQFLAETSQYVSNAALPQTTRRFPMSIMRIIQFFTSLNNRKR